MEWFLMDDTLRNVSVRFDDDGPSKGHKHFWSTKLSSHLYSIYMLEMKWYLIDNTLGNVSVRFDDYGPSKGH